MSAFIKKYAWLILLSLGVLFLAVGVLRTEAQTVFRKAVQVCLECVGLG